MTAHRSARCASLLPLSVVVLAGIRALLRRSPASGVSFAQPPRHASSLRLRPALKAVSVAEVETAAPTADGHGYQHRHRNIFPFFRIAQDSSVVSVTAQVRDAFNADMFGIVDVVVGRKEARGKLLWVLASLPRQWGAWATMAPRRFDRGQRLRIALSEHAAEEPAEEPAEILRVSSATEPEVLMGLITKLLRSPKAGGLQLHAIGQNASSVLALAIERVRFDQRLGGPDLHIRARFEDAEDLDGVRVLVVNLVDGKPAKAAMAEEESTDLADSALKKLHWTPPKVESLFTKIFMGETTSVMGVAKKVAGMLSSRTTRIVELIAFGRDVLPKVLTCIAAIPSFFDVAAQVGPENKFMLIKHYPLLLPPEVQVTRVAASTDSDKLASHMEMVMQASERKQAKGAIRFELVGTDACKVLLTAFRKYQAETRRELTFKVLEVQIADEKGFTGMHVIAMAT